MQDDSQKGGVGIWILVVVIIAVGAFWFYRSRTVETVPESGVATIVGEAIVIYDANGFSPNTVTIKKGKTVIFQNKTGKPASVASGPHPTHTNYLEFDQYKTAERGQDEFRFVFEKVGVWKYHDHLNPTMTGTVVVTE
ncbi:MAG: hypothetical protein A3C08_02150 [Candidatus Taylorbacteria bacterium RIFCSPHIGHO2_02_FULL_47_18]|uniref:Uncharacterized protein n=1 Tax=Candidatus Taylorbacteria bacterium RIFCSPLOWO2_01_FULL_48_100 TaxID=1802322 RepID=A0A1G2NDC3_9BACT|nr:MAG: hypothetical protein A2670_02615 [Candidatus Taylorbacteria bacterium RIFCSPHIGHO2_01_FULL_48_38]OHA28537.1 MAG: hypothetical protein A3C08_02150 [Candidatus Taylorbacteria bacterium RIFCSPHIGHO2_02_FULL_47_18]OHA34115.1 MAG: hypothetical protein A2938_01465 [Candidatus Taylorbacteria bacterium RIFCSPLOWO2_01_FULL_48_100]OHA40765.1 MAG: hypothetical protein A3J31_00440 [Candidatus Taylorbacteria bacterium RIFCSPLOWO2_02_FULL_48_16]OHA45374.1 MAG: hypothetical protein A3H13_00995 [Candid